MICVKEQETSSNPVGHTVGEHKIGEILLATVYLKNQEFVQALMVLERIVLQPSSLPM